MSRRASETAPQAATDRWLTQAREVVAKIELNDEVGARQLIEELSDLRRTELFQEIGKLTRELHDALNAFRFDGRLSELASQDIPDAEARLNHVISLTEQAAHRTLTAVETGLPEVRALGDRARHMESEWARFRDRRMSSEEFRALARDMDQFLPAVSAGADAVQSTLSEILMAQDFQDITGQVIKRVIHLVQEVEQSLIGLLRLGDLRREGSRPAPEDAVGAAGPAVPGVAHGDVVEGQDQVDDLLSSLGF